MNRLLLSILALSIASAANADEFEAQCGGKSFKVEVLKKRHPLVNEYRLSVIDGGGEKILYVANEGGSFHAMCIVTKNYKELFLFESYGGGYGCKEPREQFGIVEPNSLQLLLAPGPACGGDSNAMKASKILGYEVPYLPDEEGTFCCK